MDKDTQFIETIDSLLNSIAEGVYIKSFRMELCGTTDDTSHKITYTRYKKSGLLKVIDSTIAVDYMTSDIGFYYITGTELSIKDMDLFDHDVYVFLTNYQRADKSHCLEGHCFFEIKIRLSNGKKYNFLTDSEELFTEAEFLYKLLINYQDRIIAKGNKETLEEAYDRVFNYDPSIEEVEAKYDDDFNKWLDDLEV